MKQEVRMKKIFALAITLLSLSIQAKELHDTNLAIHKGIYFEPKAMITFGETIKHGDSILKGSTGYGFGLDLGYAFNENFAVEIDGSYSESDVKEILHTGESKTAKGSFYTYGANAVLTYPLHNHLIILGKLGLTYEHEDLGSLEIKGLEHGASWAAGIEYSFNPRIEVSLEYEGADIRSVRGDTLQLGLIYMF
jgi:opacity protein-like surface antigen